MRVSGGDDEEKYSAAKSNLMKAMERKADVDGLDSVFGFDAIESGERVGWLFNVCSVSLGLTHRFQFESILRLNMLNNIAPLSPDLIHLGSLTLWQTSVIDDELKVEKSAVDLYFLEMDGSTFKATYIYAPYFFIAISKVCLKIILDYFLVCFAP
jgi:hypothetical protein